MTADGFGDGLGADDHTTIGGATGTLTDGGEFPGDVDDFSRALHRRIETTLAVDESLESFLARAWAAHRDAPAVETLVDAARVECGRRDLEVDP